MDPHEYLRERPDVLPEETAEILAIARRLQGEARFNQIGLMGTREMDVRYLERAVRMYKHQKIDAERAKEQGKQLRRARNRRLLSLFSALAIVVMAAVAGIWMLGFWGASNIELERAAVELAASHVTKASDRLAAAAEEAIILTPSATDELSPFVDRLKRREDVEGRLEAAGQLDVAFDARFASMSPPRGKAQEFQAVRDELQGAYHSVQVEAERYEVVHAEWMAEVNSASGRVGRWLGLANNEL